MTAPLLYRNPVAGVVHPLGWRRPAGSRDFQVTAPFGALDAYHLTPHTGIDFGNGRLGDPVVAVAGGTVTLTRTTDGVVVIAHADGTTTVYAHLRQPFEVRKGQVLGPGQQLGRVGSTGTAAGHLHFERNIGAAHTDPWPWIQQSPLPGRRLAIPAGATIVGYLPDALGGYVKRQGWPKGSSMATDGEVSLRSGAYFRVTAGVYAGLLVPAVSVSLIAA